MKKAKKKKKAPKKPGARVRGLFGKKLLAGEYNYRELLARIPEMLKAGVNRKLVESALLSLPPMGLSPHDLFGVVRANPDFADTANAAVLKMLEGSRNSLPGVTHVIVDYNEDMWLTPLPGEVRAIDLVLSHAMVLREACETVQIYTPGPKADSPLDRCANVRGLGLGAEILHRAPVRHGPSVIRHAVRALLFSEVKDGERVVVLSTPKRLLPPLTRGERGYIAHPAVSDDLPADSLAPYNGWRFVGPPSIFSISEMIAMMELQQPTSTPAPAP